MAAASTDAWELRIGEQVRHLRLRANRTQAQLARDANVSLSTLRALESGAGSSLGTVIGVVRALGRDEWLDSLAPAEPTVSPMALLRSTERVAARPRRRARSTGRSAT